MVAITSWGRLSHEEHSVAAIANRMQAESVVARSKHGIAYGMGRSYGDACLNSGGYVWDTRGMDHFIDFNEETGQLTCEAGVLLGDIQKLVMPRGWMLSVTPGTQFVTVGGAIANDVHGKNHHVFGTFAHHVKSIALLRADGEVIRCGPGYREDWFSATVGGIGLTGVILTAEIQLRRVAGPWLQTETIPFAGLPEFLQLADSSEAGWEYTVSWIDCLSDKVRGLFARGNHTELSRLVEPAVKQKPVPFEPPVSMVNRMSLRMFNAVYYQLGKWRAGKTIEHYKPFFYPLDSISGWNKMYGPKGFFQYQCVVPRDEAEVAIQALLDVISIERKGSFLTVLKTFGRSEPVGKLSFAHPGVTLAMDFPNEGEKTVKLFEQLDSIVGEAGGRLYLAKDARMSREFFEKSYPEFKSFLAYRDPGISSEMSRRLLGA